MRLIAIILAFSITLSLLIPAAADDPAAAGKVEPVKATAPAEASTPAEPAVSASPAPRPSNRPDPAQTEVSMSFDKADINSVVRFLSLASDVPIVCDPELKGSVTIVSLKQIPLSDAYQVVNSALRVRGFTMVGNLDSKVIRVATLKKAVADGSVVVSGKELAKAGSGDNMVTQVMPLEYVSALKLKDDLKPFVSDDQASCVAITATNTLVVTDTATNIRRIAQVVEQLDKDTSDMIEVEIYVCQHSNAQALVETLSKVFQLKPSGPTGQPQPGRPPDGGQPQPTVKTDDGVVSLKGEIRIAADNRTNTVIISATRQKCDLVLDVIKRLDVDTNPEVRSEVIPLQHADASMVAEQLNKLFEQPEGGAGGGRRSPYDWWSGSSSSSSNQPGDYAGLKRNVIVADVRTNSIIVTASDQNLREVKTMIEKLDAPNVLSEITQIFPLKYADAEELGDTLSRLFRGESRRRGSFYDFIFGDFGSNRNEQGGPLDQLRNITVVAEAKTNTLLITGPPQVFNMIKQLIDRVDKRTTQVFIEVAIVDVTLDHASKFGVEWSWNSTTTRPDGDVINQNANTNFGLGSQSLGLKYSVISDNLKALLHALESRSDVKVYSTPTITTADNVEALISIGRDEPYVSSEDIVNDSIRRSVEFKPVAVALTVTPHVNDTSDIIALDVHQTIDEIIGREVELNAPVVAKREARTSVTVKDGQTIVIGGIIKENHEWIVRGVPFLSRLPLIGAIFRTKERRNQKSELMVFLTPHVLKDDISVDNITEQTRKQLNDAPNVVIEKSREPVADTPKTQ